jgi:hypothetical protein
MIFAISSQPFLRRFVAAVVFGFAGLSAYGATHTISVYIDRDHRTETGCVASLPGGPFAGAELELRTTIVTDMVAAHVDQVEVLTCNGVIFTSPVVVDSGDWPVPIGFGDSATSIVDTYLPLSFLAGAPLIRVAIGTTSDSMAVAPGGGPILLALTADVPLSPGILALLALALSTLGVMLLNRRARQPFVAVSLVAFVLIAALPLADWTGQPARATDPKGDAPVNADLVSFYAQIHSGALLMRIHADVQADSGGGNLAPQVNAGADQSITLPDNGAVLAGAATDDGQPLPSALTYQWSWVSGPAGVLLTTPTAATTDAGFGVAGTYVLRLTASDGALSNSDEITMTVNAETNGPPLLAAIADRTVALGETLAIQVVADDPNPRDTLTYSLTASPAGAQLSPSGSPSFRFTPTFAQLGPQLVTVRAQDQAGLSDTEDFLITVVNGNEPPVLATQISERIPAGGAFARTLSATDPDLPGDALTLSLLDGPAGMSVVGAQLQWTPAAGDRGDHLVTVAVRDLAGAQDQERFVLTVHLVAAPVAHADAYEVALGQTLTVPAPGVLTNDVDPEGGTLTATKLTDPDKGTVTSFGADGSFAYQAPASLPPPPPLDVQAKWLGFNIGGVAYFDSQVIGDLDGDGRPEIVFGYPNNNLAAVKSDGTALFTYGGALPAPNADCWAATQSQMALGDINDDGDVEIVLSVTCTRDQVGGPFAFANNRVAALSYNPATSGIVVDWLSPSASTDANRSFTQNAHYTIARLAPNEPPSVLWGGTFNSATGPCSSVIAGKTDSNCRVVTAHSGADGTMTRRFYFAAANFVPDWGSSYGFLGSTVPIVADLDGDGDPEIVGDGTVWNLDGTVALGLDGSPTSQPPTVLDSVGADLDGDGSAEIITAQLYNGFGSLGPLSAYHADGTLMWRLMIPGSTVQSRMTVADLDRDGRPEILFSVYSSLYAVDADGRYKWVRTFDHSGLQYLNAGGGFSTRFAVYDLNADGIVEVIVQDGKNDVLFLRGDTGATQTSWHYSDPDHLSEPGSGSQGQLAPTVADLDGDGHAEVVVQHDINLNGTYGIVALEGINAWRSVPNWFNQRAYVGSNIDADGGIPSVPPRYWTTAATNVLGQQPPAPYALDPRLRTETSFQYRSRNVALDSAPANVTIGILPDNRPPVITSTPPATAALQDYRFTPPGPLTYQITAVDPDVGDTISYQLTYQGCGNSGTVTVSPSGLFSYADNQPGSNVLCLFSVNVQDNHGSATPHVFSIFFTNESGVVPDLVGDDQSDAPAQLAAVNLIVGNVVEMVNAAPAGQIISQTPSAGSTVPRGSRVDLNVSSGPQPRVVPDVVGRPVLTAGGLLVAGGFTAGVTTYVYDPVIPRNEVIAQSPSAGTEIIPTPVALTVSAGTGLELRLERMVTTSDVPIAFTAVSFSVAGVEGPTPALNYVVTPVVTPFAGSLPTVVGSNVTFNSATRGGFRLTATDPGTGRMAVADFAVAQPRLPGADSQMEQFARLTEALTDMQEFMRQAKVAADANDTVTATARVTDFVLRWRAVDGVALRQAAPFSPETGFPPQIEDLPPSVVPGPDDFINRQLIREAGDALEVWTEGLRADDTSLAELNTLGNAFIDKAHLLRGLTPGEYGTVLAAPSYAAIAAHRIPDLMDALTDELAIIVGLPPLAPAATSRRVKSDSTLSELVVTQAVNAILDQVNEAQQYTKQILHQAFYGAAVVAITQHVKSFVQGKEIEAVISGASMSFRFFESPYSMIEGKGLEWEDPDLNTVLVIGPQLFSSLSSLVEKIKGASKVNADPDDPSGEPRFKNLDELFDAFKALIDAAQAAGQAFDNAQQPTKLADRPCIFTSDPTCVQLMYPDGFKSVYEYAPPSGLSQLTGLPLPIVFVVKNNVNGQVLFDTPIFFPSVPEEP